MTSITDAELEREVSEWSEQLERLTRTCAWLQCVTVLAKTESTQDAVLCRADSVGSAIVAGRQTGGRGRRGRVWADDLGRGIALSVAVESEDSALLCARAAVALAHAYVPLIGQMGIRSGIKWPNDLIAIMDRPRKIGGVLVEEHGDQAVMGLGVNVRSRVWPEQLRNSAGTLEDTGIRVTRLEAIVHLLKSLDRVMTMSKEQLQSEFIQADLLEGERLVFEESGTLHEGVVREVDPFTGVLLVTRDGEVRLRPELARLHAWESHVNDGGEGGGSEPM